MEEIKKPESSWQDRATWWFLILYGIINLGGLLMIPLMLALLSGHMPAVAWLAVPFVAVSPWLSFAMFFMFPFGLYLGVYNLRKKKKAIGVILILCALPMRFPHFRKEASNQERQQKNDQRHKEIVTLSYKELSNRLNLKWEVVGYKDFGCLVVRSGYTACLHQPPGLILSNEKRQEISKHLQNEFIGKMIRFDVTKLTEEEVFKGIDPALTYNIFYADIYYNDQKLNDLLK